MSSKQQAQYGIYHPMRFPNVVQHPTHTKINIIHHSEEQILYIWGSDNIIVDLKDQLLIFDVRYNTSISQWAELVADAYTTFG